MSDVMRFFPELAINGHKHIADKIEWLISEPSRYCEIQQRSITTAQEFSFQKDAIMKQWHDLLEAMAVNQFDDSNSTLKLQPTLSFFGSKRMLKWRQFFQFYFIFKRRLNIYRARLQQQAKQPANTVKPV
jgi:hypothetical protein